ncbi:MAG: hypothetical protein K1060chlam2_00792 [Chlamydiae bacterium]|nr:hypothetical protein [Chlamydiota bacterium]
MSSISITGSDNEILNRSLNYFSKEIMNFSPEKLYLVSQLFLVKMNYYTGGFFSSWKFITLTVLVGAGATVGGIYEFTRGAPSNASGESTSMRIPAELYIPVVGICALAATIAIGTKIYNNFNKASYERMYNHTKHVMQLKELTPFGDIPIPAALPKPIQELVGNAS